MIHYTKEYIGQLLERYMEGTSTLEEEDIIANYLNGDDVPREWEVYREMFREIEAMQPVAASKPVRRRVLWGVAAAIAVAIVAFATVRLQQREQQPVAPLVVKADSTYVKQSAEAEKAKADTLRQQPQKPQPAKTRKRSLRKAEPTIHDEMKAYALMAEVEREQMEKAQQMAEIEMKIKEYEMLAIQPLMQELGFVAVRHEDGNIYYVDEKMINIAYEE